MHAWQTSFGKRPHVALEHSDDCPTQSQGSAVGQGLSAKTNTSDVAVPVPLSAGKGTNNATVNVNVRRRLSFPPRNSFLPIDDSVGTKPGNEEREKDNAEIALTTRQDTNPWKLRMRTRGMSFPGAEGSFVQVQQHRPDVDWVVGGDNSSVSYERSAYHTPQQPIPASCPPPKPPSPINHYEPEPEDLPPEVFLPLFL